MTFDISNIIFPSYDINYENFREINSVGNLSQDENKTTKSIKICCWNVNGIRSQILRPCKSQELQLQNSVVKTFNPSVGLGRLIDSQNPDIFCLQETKSSVEYINNIKVEGWDIYASDSKKLNNRSANRYSGTAIFVNREKMGKPVEIIKNLPGLGESDDEGRIVALRFMLENADGDIFETERSFWLVNAYTPNSGTNSEFRNKVWNPLMFNFLSSLRNVIYCGDMNVARTLYDITYKLYDGLSMNFIDAEYTKKMIAGFRPDERKWFDELLKSGFIDVWRRLNINEDDVGYTYVDNIKKAFKMRIDYFLLKMLDNPYSIESCIVDEYKKSESDHIPIIMTVKL